MRYTYSVVTLPEVLAAGISIQTDMQKAQTDCPALWQQFGPLMAQEMADHPYVLDGQSYGISIMQNEQAFTYWAALGVKPDTTEDMLPTGVRLVRMAAGDYVQCTVPNLEQIGSAYEELYSEWPATQHTHQLDMSKPGFEAYQKNCDGSIPFALYAPLLKV